MAQQTKSAYTSKANILGALQLLAGIVSLVAGSDLIASNPKLVSGLVMASGVLTIVIRQLTTMPVSWSGKPE